MEQRFCIICKEIVNPRYSIIVSDKESSIEIKDNVCASCYEKLFESHNNQGFFKVSKMFSWLRKGRKDIKRL